MGKYVGENRLADILGLIKNGFASSSHVHNDLAPKASPAFTGTPTAPTAASGTDTTQIATTAFVNAAINPTHSTDNLTDGTLPVARGGTAKTTITAIRAYYGSIGMGTSLTEAATAAKVVTLAGFGLFSGARIAVKFTNASTVASEISLNVNSTGAKAVYCGGSATSSSNPVTWAAGAICEFVYDGSYWHYIGNNIDGAYAAKAVDDALGVILNVSY